MDARSPLNADGAYRVDGTAFSEVPVLRASPSPGEVIGRTRIPTPKLACAAEREPSWHVFFDWSNQGRSQQPLFARANLMDQKPFGVPTPVGPRLTRPHRCTSSYCTAVRPAGHVVEAGRVGVRDRCRVRRGVCVASQREHGRDHRRRETGAAHLGRSLPTLIGGGVVHGRARLRVGISSHIGDAPPIPATGHRPTCSLRLKVGSRVD
jgi:hypothetical protein